MKKFAALTVMALAGSLTAGTPAVAAESTARVELKKNESQGQLRILIDGKEAVVYQYGKDVDMPHYYPVHSPSGRLLTVQQTDPYPHHRSIWFADKVQLAGQRRADFYASLYSKDKKKPATGFRDRIRHVKFLGEQVTADEATVKAQLLWEADYGETPVIDEWRRCRVVPLEKGEYLLDLSFEIKASYGDVTFASDQTHYAWPYVRMHPRFSVDGGGTMTSSKGVVTKDDIIDKTGMYRKHARWVDYSNTVGGVTEGIAIFATDKEEPRWFTRDYGTFGPRRPDAKSGVKFTLKKGESLTQRVGILVHSGDAAGGCVKARCRRFIESKL